MLHPDARALLDLIAERNLPAMHTLAPVDARAFYRDRRAFTQPPAPEVGADSAGVNLAAVVALLARDAGNLPIAYQLLIYPATDMRRRHPSHASNGSGYLLTTETIAYYHDHYIADPAHDLDWRASPLLHVDLTRLPPAPLLTAGFDPLRDERLESADRLVRAGNRAAYVCFERQIHGFITMGKVIDEAHAA